ncbi:MAG: phosphonate ABC transporter, permease protein PhnE [Candidatus Methylomirabilales bacterium]
MAPVHTPTVDRHPVAATQSRRWFPFAMTAAVAIVVWWSAQGTGVDLALLLWEGPRAILDYGLRLFPPDLSPGFLAETALGTLETLAISIMGSLLSMMVAASLVFFASANLTFTGVLFERERAGRLRRGLRPSIYLAAKGLLNLLRTIPEIVWATVFVFAVGLGPFPGVLALGVHNGGVLGKLFGEVLENVDPHPIEALQATGASRFQVLIYGILPQALPQFLSYSLYRWEVNIRAAAILGLVGAGGLGQQIHIAISLFLENQLLTLLLAIFLIVTLVDYLSASLRRRLT